MSARGLFVAGSHTDIGKTYVACALIRAARRGGLAVDALKPVVSGFDVGDWRGSDPGRLLEALAVEPTQTALDAISPWRFAAPLAPPMAAAREGRALPFADVARFCAARLADCPAELMVVEGVGGLMSPIADGATGLDLMSELRLPSVLIVGSYLGAISHGLTALKVLRADALAVLGVVVSQSGDGDAPDFAETVQGFRDFAGETPVVAAPRGTETPWADDLITRLNRRGAGLTT
jgi:dethiobiotin synthetase